VNVADRGALRISYVIKWGTPSDRAGPETPLTEKAFRGGRCTDYARVGILWGYKAERTEMVSTFLVSVAGLSFFWGALFLYETSATGDVIAKSDLLVALLCWSISSVCLGSAAVVDGIRTATRKMFEKLDEVATQPS
jgi:hypothetical protein